MGDKPKDKPADLQAAPATKVEKNETLFCFTGSFQIDEQKVQVVAKTGDETLIELTKPAKLGNALTIGTWLNNTWNTPVDILLVKKPGQDKMVESQSQVTPEEVRANLGSLPETIRKSVATLLLANVWITDLYIRSWKVAPDDKSNRTAMKFGIMVDITGGGASDGLELLPGIKLLDVGFVVSNAPPKYEFPVHKLLPTAEPVRPEKLQEIAAADSAARLAGPPANDTPPDRSAKPPPDKEPEKPQT